MNISPPSAFHPVARGSLPEQTPATQVVRRIERSNITPGDLAKFLHDRTVREFHAIAGSICSEASRDPDFNGETLKKQLRESGFGDINKPGCEGGEKHQCITGLLQHLQEESLKVDEGVDGPEATKFCQLIQTPDSCLGKGSDWLIDVMNTHQQLLEAESRLSFDIFPNQPLSLLCKGYPTDEGGIIGQTTDHGVDHQFPEAQPVSHNPPVNTAPSAPSAYDDVAGAQAAPGQPEMSVRPRESELSEQQRCARGLNVIASQLEHYSLGPSGTGTPMENMAEILQRMRSQATPPETKVASGERLTSLAQQVRMPFVNVFRNDNISLADIGVNIVGNNQDIQPVVSASWLPLKKFPSTVQERLKLAADVISANEETSVPIVQVYLCASSEKALEGAEFTVELRSTMKFMGNYLSNLLSSDTDNMIPISAELRMPKGLKQGADFHEATFALHTVSDRRVRRMVVNASFSHGKGETREKEKHNIGIQQVAPILEAIGFDRKTAMSSKAGLAIPFGFTLLKQDESKFVRRVTLLESGSTSGGRSTSGIGSICGGMNKPGVGGMYGGMNKPAVGGMYGGMNKPGGGTLFGERSQSVRGSPFGASTLFGGGPYGEGNVRGSNSADPIDLRNSIRAGGETTRSVSLPTEIEPKVNRLSTSGINPLPCTTEKEYRFSTKKDAREPFATVAGIVWVQTVTSLPGIETRADLKRWIDKQKVDPENPVLPGIL
ncbi:hypothetical protein [Endozoicomonas sp. YOMI1]|uniref:hypothetical protein n=1 Tax=Endozoicomonas sp. YOMI1 TaxID=2828739 RepID=UPI0021493535|nr:hypothetical protein [Endozoicomonas sp. YOMI1]